MSENICICSAKNKFYIFFYFSIFPWACRIINFSSSGYASFEHNKTVLAHLLFKLILADTRTQINTNVCSASCNICSWILWTSEVRTDRYEDCPVICSGLYGKFLLSIWAPCERSCICLREHIFLWIWFNRYDAGLLHVEIATEVGICWNNRCTLQWISQQPIMIEHSFNPLNTLPWEDESVISDYAYIEKKLF